MDGPPISPAVEDEDKRLAYRGSDVREPANDERVAMSGKLVSAAMVRRPVLFVEAQLFEWSRCTQGRSIQNPIQNAALRESVTAVWM